MVNVLLIFVLLTPQQIVDSICFERAERIYKRIVEVNEIVDAPELHRYKDNSVNASTIEQQDGAIYLNDGMLRYAHNEDELALILGHELGHWVHRGREIPYYMEYWADDFGARAMEKAGYNRCKGALIMWRFDSADSDTHPDSESRWKAITKLCYKGENNGN